jgi:hypothetical protein
MKNALNDLLEVDKCDLVSRINRLIVLQGNLCFGERLVSKLDQTWVFTEELEPVQTSPMEPSGLKGEVLAD